MLTPNLVSFNPTDFEVSKIYQGNVQSLCCLAHFFFNTLAVISRKESEIVGEIFSPALEMQLCLFYLKYQERDVQIQPSLTKIEVLKSTNC